MGGTLMHSKSFTKDEYVGNDNRPHFELRPVDGDSTNLSHSSWREMKDLAETHGMPRKVWPEFLDHDFGIDVPIDEVYARQGEFRQHLLALPLEVVRSHYWLERLVGWAREGEAILFCGN